MAWDEAGLLSSAWKVYTAQITLDTGKALSTKMLNQYYFTDSERATFQTSDSSRIWLSDPPKSCVVVAKGSRIGQVSFWATFHYAGVGTAAPIIAIGRGKGSPTGSEAGYGMVDTRVTGGGDEALSYATAFTHWRIANQHQDFYYFPCFASRTGFDGLEIVSDVGGEDQTKKGLSTMLFEVFY